MDEALRPCPFCGGEYVQVLDNSDPHIGEDWIICCDNCGGAFIASNDAMPCTRSELIQRWNSRVKREQPSADVLARNYKAFWPHALTENDERLYASGSTNTMEQAVQQISIWEEFYGYRIVKAWVEEGITGKRIPVKRQWVAKKEGDVNDISK